MKFIKLLLWAAICITPFYYLNAQPDFSSGFQMIDCGNTRIVFNNRCTGNQDSIVFVHVHENETTAVEAVNRVMDSTIQGCFITWQCQQQRLIKFELNNLTYRFDPNRIYTTKGIRATLKSGGNYSDSALIKVNSIANAFKEKYITNKKLIIAVHNNTDAGSLSINSYKRGSSFAMDAESVFVSPKRDADDFFLTTETIIFEKIKRLGYNVVLQNNLTVLDDGSLSVYCGKQRIPYVNVEAQNGHLKEQKEMLSSLWQLLQN